jgi:eukaryotic-like serine/threonine-protein kinase
VTASDASLHEIARAILDNTEVDWVKAESSAEESIRHVIRELKVIAEIAVVHGGEPRGPERTPAASECADSDSGLGCWGPLRLLEKIGEGAYGEVFRAWDTRLDREVALKLLLPGHPRSARPMSSVIHEGQLLARVRHPNVVTVYGAEQVNDRIGLWMELVRGRNLEQMLGERPPFSAAETARIGTEICRALSAVHRAGLLHRDIKAHNVMLADDGRVVLMDFGAGRDVADRSSSDLAGTPLYLAPEVLDGGAATPQSDIYSLGVLLYHMLTGSYPTPPTRVRDVRRALDGNERARLRTLRPDVPQPFARAIKRACDPRPERRYREVDALCRDLAAFQHPPMIKRLRYGSAIAAAGLLVALAVPEVRVRLARDQRSVPSGVLGPTSGPSASVDGPVIVVLPFRNLGTEPGSDLLVDSLTAGLIQQLGIIDGLKVTFQQSSFSLRDKRRDPAGIGKHLPVNLVVDGDAQLSGGSLVIHAALLPVAGGTPVWADTLTREIGSAGDLTDVLTEIARTIVNKLRLNLGPTQRRYDTDIATYVTYLRARALRDMRLSKAREAIPLFEEVIRRDASFAPAYAALAATYGDLTMSWPSPDSFALAPREATARMAPLSDRALEIDPMLAEAHVARAYMHALARRWVDAETSFRHAIRLDPTITAVYGDFVLSTLEPWGRLDESLATLQTALVLDPLSLDLRNVLSRIQLSAGQFDAALANCRRVVAEDPDFPFAEEYCARALAAKGRTDEALTLFNKRRLSNEHGIGYVYAITGRRAEAEELAARNSHLPNRQALIYAGLGDKDRAFEALERLALLNPRRAGAYLNYPELIALRGDPRGQTLRRKLGFEQ